MAESIRKKIMAAIAARLARIRTTNGYNTNCGQKVITGRKAFHPSELPLCGVSLGTETRSGGQYRYYEIALPVTIEAYQAIGSSPANQIEDMLADLIECVLGNEGVEPTANPTSVLTGGYGSRVEYDSGGANEWPDANDEVVGCGIGVTVTYSVEKGNPYGQGTT